MVNEQVRPGDSKGVPIALKDGWTLRTREKCVGHAGDRTLVYISYCT